MEFLTDKFRDIFWFVATAVAAALAPVQNVLIGLLWAFAFNIIMGIIADIHVNKAGFSIKKAFNAITQLMFYAVCVVFLDYEARLLREAEIGAMAVKWLTLIVLYFYLTNIFRNAKLIFPKNQAIALIYELLSTEIFGRLKNMLGKK